MHMLGSSGSTSEPSSLGDGKRMLVKGGKFNKAYQITVPEEMNAVS